MSRTPRPVRSVTGMNLKLSSCTLAVHDVDEALGFYRDVLGFEVRDDVETEGTRWVRVGPPSQPDVQIRLGSPGADPGASPADRQAIEDLMAKGLLGRLVFVTDNCDATFEHIEAAGAEVMQEPINQLDGVRDCAFLDPSGNMLRFTQPWQVVLALASQRAHAATAPQAP
ncbi:MULTISPECIES: VOC family protein [Streptosporangium]|uniref:Catechol 2,3-dioxygenase-like lactoylglutathione lyase family enzyme n=1 Tax=Streptosporangium brasiliense TaxID=47480 RepID=A0ABT9R3D3_9ACTN|nr:VOC family protein [Streptosporangium brasiliense]MDP9863745.1 catechol 2,3-dioxygenase-like lactoylglutathione lyase family enzyme [Streptosporangium brasiliense]